MAILSDQGRAFFALFYFFYKDLDGLDPWFSFAAAEKGEGFGNQAVTAPAGSQKAWMQSPALLQNSSSCNFYKFLFFFFPLWKKKTNKIPIFLPVPLLFLLAPTNCSLTSLGGGWALKFKSLSLWCPQRCPPCSLFLCPKDRILHRHWWQGRKAMGLNCRRKINLDIRKQWKVRENGEDCSYPWSNPAHCFVNGAKPLSTFFLHL